MLHPFARSRDDQSASAFSHLRASSVELSEDVSSRTLALPFFTALERDQQERVVEVLAAALS